MVFCSIFINGFYATKIKAEKTGNETFLEEGIFSGFRYRDGFIFGMVIWCVEVLMKLSRKSF